MGDWRDDKEKQECEYILNKQGHNSHTIQKQGEHPQKQNKMDIQLNTPVNGKVKSVTGAGTYNDLFTFEYTFEDGTIMKANHKTNAPRFNQGDDVVYTVKFTNTYGNLGSIDKPQQAGGGGSQQHSNLNQPVSTPQVNINDSILFQVCLKEASAQMVAHGTTMPSENDIVEFAYKIAVASKKAIDGLKNV